MRTCRCCSTWTPPVPSSSSAPASDPVPEHRRPRTCFARRSSTWTACSSIPSRTGRTPEREVFGSVGIDITDEMAADHGADDHSPGRRALVRRVGRGAGASIEDMEAAVIARVADHIRARARALPGVHECSGSAGAGTGASRSRRIPRPCSAISCSSVLGIAGAFHTVVSADDVERASPIPRSIYTRRDRSACRRGLCRFRRLAHGRARRAGGRHVRGRDPVFGPDFSDGRFASSPGARRSRGVRRGNRLDPRADA